MDLMCSVAGSPYTSPNILTIPFVPGMADRGALKDGDENEGDCIRPVESDGNVHEFPELFLLEDACIIVRHWNWLALMYLRRYVQRIPILMVGKATRYNISATK